MNGTAAGSSKKATVYVSGLAPEVNEQQLLDAFVTFGEAPSSLPKSSLLLLLFHQHTLILVQAISSRSPSPPNHMNVSPHSTVGSELTPKRSADTASKHRGFAFLTFANPADALDAIDNFDLNELPGYQGRGKFLKCNIAQPNKYGTEAQGDKFDRPGELVRRSRRGDADDGSTTLSVGIGGVVEEVCEAFGGIGR